MSEDVKRIADWIENSNAFEVLGQLRHLGLLTRADLEKAMHLSRSEWIAFMKEKAGVAGSENNTEGERHEKEKEKEA